MDFKLIEKLTEVIIADVSQEIKQNFSEDIRCADCGYALRIMSANMRKRPDITDCVHYSYNNYGRYGNTTCTAHNIEERDLFNAVLAAINRFANMVANDEKATRAIEKRLTEIDQSRAKELEKEQRKLNKRLVEIDRLSSSLYEDKVLGRITERNFEMMLGKYQKEQLEIKARLKEVTETLNESYEKSQGFRDFLSLIRNYQGITELDVTIINALIDKIFVSEREKFADETVWQEIKIYYKFIGFVGELHITPTKRWAALKPKNCTVCGVEYVPCSAISKYCPECRERIRKVQGTETKRKSRERKRTVCIELSAKNDRLVSDDIAEALMRGVTRDLRAAIKNPKDYNAQSNLMWEAAMAENRIIKLGKKTDFECHQMEHQLGAFTDCNHGAGLVVLHPVYYRHIYKNGLAKFRRFAVEVWNVPADGRTYDELALAGIEALENFIIEIGLPATLRDLGVDEKTDLKTIADSCSCVPGAYKVVTHKEILEIFKECY